MRLYLYTVIICLILAQKIYTGSPVDRNKEIDRDDSELYLQLQSNEDMPISDNEEHKEPNSSPTEIEEASDEINPPTEKESSSEHLHISLQNSSSDLEAEKENNPGLCNKSVETENTHDSFLEYSESENTLDGISEISSDEESTSEENTNARIFPNAVIKAIDTPEKKRKLV